MILSGKSISIVQYIHVRDLLTKCEVSTEFIEWLWYHYTRDLICAISCFCFVSYGGPVVLGRVGVALFERRPFLVSLCFIYICRWGYDDDISFYTNIIYSIDHIILFSNRNSLQANKSYFYWHAVLFCLIGKPYHF
jgi:hypothetical protein